MWYEILPSVFLTWAPLAIGGTAIILGGNYLFLNKHIYGPKNMMRDDRDYMSFLRDRRITGNEYYPRGVEEIDQPPKVYKKHNFFHM